MKNSNNLLRTKFMDIDLDNVSINGKRFPDWDEKNQEAFFDGLIGNNTISKTKSTGNSTNSSKNSSKNWTDKFNIGNPDKDKGHWVTLDNGKHLFIKDDKSNHSKNTSHDVKTQTTKTKNQTQNPINNKKEDIKKEATNQKTIQRETTSNDNKKGTMTGGASPIKKADFSKQSKYNINVKINEKLNHNYPDAKELANIFLVKPENVPNSDEYKYLEPKYAKTVNEIYGLFNTNKRIDQNWPGFVYSKDSTLSINVSNSIEVQNQIRKQFNDTLNKFKTDKLEISCSEPNLLLALGHATILKPYIDETGYFHGILFDKYDFDLLYKIAYKSPAVYLANDYFWALQYISGKRNFYILAPVSFKW